VTAPPIGGEWRSTLDDIPTLEDEVKHCNWCIEEADQALENFRKRKIPPDAKIRSLIAGQLKLRLRAVNQREHFMARLAKQLRATA
jgi:hypothetical protein